MGLDRFALHLARWCMMPSMKPDVVVATLPPRRACWLLLVISMAAFAWSLPRPFLQDVVVGRASDSPHATAVNDATRPPGRQAFRTSRRLSELVAKGPLAAETELSGPCLADEGQTLYFARARPGQRADIVRSRRDGERWLRPAPVRELNSVDDDRHVTIDVAGRSLLLASNRSGSRGGFDLYEATRDRDRWS